MDAPTVRLTDLDIIKRFSLAVRQESAPAADVLEALDASRAAVMKVIGKPSAKKAAARTTKAARRA